METEKRPLIILTGPTAVGKTELSIELAKSIGGEIVSADSMQVYRGMDIGTAKIKKEQMQGVTHHLIDIINPDEEFNVSIFKELAVKAIDEIYSRGNIPILTGGTGFYIQSVLYDVQFEETDKDDSYRRELKDFADKNGVAALHARLNEIDSHSAAAIHPNNIKRVIRAIEYFHQTGKPISEHNEKARAGKPAYRFKYFVLSLPREILYPRIDKRVDIMREEGLEREVLTLREKGYGNGLVSMQGLGYKELLAAFDGKYSIDTAFEKIKQGTRHFAKRQFTWFGRERDVTWVEKASYKNNDSILDYIIGETQK